MSQALALLTLMLVARLDPSVRDAAIAIARLLDRQVLAQLADASAFTGFMLSALTAWGYFRYWWVLAKFVITVAQLTVGIFFLDPDGTPLSIARGGADDVRDWIPGVDVDRQTLEEDAMG
ncbi:hypothetical protein [Fodinicola feengrottensis]|uniref:hypothetical protein n=1 Tax=Fodinicola feengrottensis TaxID=435914 RepID=UPI002441EB1B|nr:hypothetical protein [Fodinicola feengrottensis]